jgi:hypothetical protein
MVVGMDLEGVIAASPEVDHSMSHLELARDRKDLLDSLGRELATWARWEDSMDRHRDGCRRVADPVARCIWRRLPWAEMLRVSTQPQRNGRCVREISCSQLMEVWYQKQVCRAKSGEKREFRVQ